MNKLKPIEYKFWQKFLQNRGLSATANLVVRASMPGNKQVADVLVELYLTGRKSAGSGLVKDYEMPQELPKKGDYWIILDSIERPRCIAKTIRVEIHPFDQVTEAIARAEGEGDLSVDYWRRAHREFFAPYLARLGIDNLSEALVVTEFFEIVFPEIRRKPSGHFENRSEKRS